MKTFLLFSVAFFIACILHAQVSINNDGNPPENSAMLEVKSTARGMLVPRMTTGQRTSILNPAHGLLVYDYNTASFWFYDGLAWKDLSADNYPGWRLTGNSNTNSAVNFIGTTDSHDLIFKVNSIESGRIEQMGNLNTSFGYATLSSATWGANNVAFGYETLMHNTEGSINSAFGYNALWNNLDGSSNTAIGMKALLTNSSGDDNTALGAFADVGAANLSNATAIGAHTTVGASNCVVLGNNANVGIGLSSPIAKLHLQVNGYDAYSGLVITSTIPGGKSLSINQGLAGKLNFTNPGITDLVTMDFNSNRVGIYATSPSHLLQLGIDDAYKPGTSTWGIISDRRVKEDIHPFIDGWNVLRMINPVWFTYNGAGGTPKGETAIGTIAQDLQAVAPYMVSETETGEQPGSKTNYLGVNYHALFFILVNTVREQNKAMEQLTQQVAELRQRIENMGGKNNGR